MSNILLLRANEATNKQRIAENNRLKEEVSKLKNNIQYIKSQYAVSNSVDF